MSFVQQIFDRAKSKLNKLGQTQRDRFQPWIENSLRPRFPELEAPLMAAIDAFDAVQQTGKLPPESLRPIVDAVSSPRTLLYENACGFMRTLSAEWPEVNAAILAMSQSSKAHIRFNAILCLGKSTPSDIVEKVLKSGLLDKSSRVRIKAADWIGRLRKAEFVPELTAALSIEQNVEARSTIEFELRLLRDGYILEPASGGSYDITVYIEEGGVRSSYVSQETLNKLGIEKVASKLRCLGLGESME
jgi:hypothetical protein